MDSSQVDTEIDLIHIGSIKHIISAAMSLKLNYQLMKPDDVQRTLDRMAAEILGANNGRPVVLIGIQRRGVPMARRIAIRMAERTQREPQIGTLDINLYRDDLTRVSSQPVVQKTEVPPNIDDHDVVLVDDVLYRSEEHTSEFQSHSF